MNSVITETSKKINISQNRRMLQRVKKKSTSIN